MRSEFVFWWSGGQRDQRLPLTAILGVRAAFSRFQLGAAGFPDLFKCRTLVTFPAPRKEFFVVLVCVGAMIQQAFAIVVTLTFHVEGDAHVLLARWIVW